MQLTQFTDYSLRALIYIATKQENCTINEIAQAYKISKNHLIKIIHNLSKLKVIKTIQGKNGGISMAVKPEELNLKKLVMLLEPHFDLVPCFNIEKQNCCIAPVCYLKKVLLEANMAFLAVLDRYSLQDMIGNKSELKNLLMIN